MKLHENEQQAAEEEGQLVVVVQPLPHAIPPSKEVGLCTASFFVWIYLFGIQLSRARSLKKGAAQPNAREQDSSFFCVVWYPGYDFLFMV